MNSKNQTEDTRDRTKAVLICSACGHAAPMGDEWCLTRCEHRTEIECPNCGSVVVSQPTFDLDETRRTIAAC